MNAFICIFTMKESAAAAKAVGLLLVRKAIFEDYNNLSSFFDVPF